MLELEEPLRSHTATADIKHARSLFRYGEACFLWTAVVQPHPDPGNLKADLANDKSVSRHSDIEAESRSDLCAKLLGMVRHAKELLWPVLTDPGAILSSPFCVLRFSRTLPLRISNDRLERLSAWYRYICLAVSHDLTNIFLFRATSISRSSKLPPIIAMSNQSRGSCYATYADMFVPTAPLPSVEQLTENQRSQLRTFSKENLDAASEDSASNETLNSYMDNALKFLRACAAYGSELQDPDASQPIDITKKLAERKLTDKEIYEIARLRKLEEQSQSE